MLAVRLMRVYVHTPPSVHADMRALLPMYINPETGNFQMGSTITLGARGDSYYEYLLKQWLLTGKKQSRYLDKYLEVSSSQPTTTTERAHYAFSTLNPEPLSVSSCLVVSCRRWMRSRSSCWATRTRTAWRSSESCRAAAGSPPRWTTWSARSLSDTCMGSTGQTDAVDDHDKQTAWRLSPRG